MKKIIRKIKRKINASKKKRSSVDPITAYKARLEVGIYIYVLDLIIKELQAETEPSAPTVTETVAPSTVRPAAEVQVA